MLVLPHPSMVSAVRSCRHVVSMQRLRSMKAVHSAFMSQFLNYRSQQFVPCLDWSSDACTSSPDTRPTFNFIIARRAAYCCNPDATKQQPRTIFSYAA